MRLLLSASALAALAFAESVLARPLATVGIRGQWRVDRAEFADPASVQAYSSVQLRAVVGGSLIISRSSAHWVLPPKSKRLLAEHEAFFETCSSPTVHAFGDDQYELRCRDRDSFAPGMTMMIDGTLVLMWWDGVELYLRKEK